MNRVHLQPLLELVYSDGTSRHKILRYLFVFSHKYNARKETVSFIAPTTKLIVKQFFSGMGNWG